MSKIRVQSQGSKIRIKLHDDTQTPPQRGGGETTPVEPTKTTPQDRKVLLLPARLIDLMEIRAESAFRPNEEDVELVYALSGSDPRKPDMIHKLSSRTVVEEASEEHIISSVEATMEHILKERNGIPALIVDVHTHPESVPKPSDTDKQFFQTAAAKIAIKAPHATVLFGVHAISSESIRERQKPSKISRNTIRWSSITREHEVGFFTPKAEPYEVEIID